ncbi:MAG: hypothetical protein F6K39_10390 [Okeania sp. SIO3B3]|nr:hypothetical protein [Okeania sp. SIO3B3]
MYVFFVCNYLKYLLDEWSLKLYCRRKKEEGRRKKEEGRRKKEEGRRKKENIELFRREGTRKVFSSLGEKENV